MNYVFLVLIIVMIIMLISIVYTSWRNGISPMPASIQTRNAVCNELKRYSPNGKVVDAGSGFGVMAVHLSLHCSDLQIVGLENSPFPLWISRLYWRIVASIKKAPLQNVFFLNEDLYSYDYSDVDIIIFYLYPGAMSKIKQTIIQQLPAPITIISVCFALPHMHPTHTIQCNDLFRTKVYVYKKESNPKR